MHIPTPKEFLYVPAAHGLQATPTDEALCPRAQIQSVTTVLPAVDIVFVGHNEHVELPTTFLYVPAAHAVHVVSPDPVYPARQVQMELPMDEKVLRGQSVHFVALINE